MYTPAIVIIAYNRAQSLKRLLGSIAGARYLRGISIPLVISIDCDVKSGVSDEVRSVAESFEWSHGEKRVIAREKSLGLKAHVLLCSSLAKDYGSAIILEDDLYVAADFYTYSTSALSFCSSHERIAGVSLYNHLLNVHAREPFEAINDGYDNWYFQFASSWGQAYTDKQWSAFESWMEKNDGTPFGEEVPQNVRSWGDGSWLKYFIRYCIEEDKLFFYPRVSRSTNFSEAGTHRMGQSADLQVPLSYAGELTYRFSEPEKSGAVYDAYFESMALPLEDTIVDLYGKKPLPTEGGYFLSSQTLPYKAVRGYGRQLRPIDANILCGIEGSAFYLYDMSAADRPPVINDREKLLYNYRAFKAKYGIEITLSRIFDR